MSRHIKPVFRISPFASRPTLKVGLLGCMAERLKDKLLTTDRLVDMVAGPDSYRDLPRLLAITSLANESSINVLLSLEETYADVMPMRLNEDQITGYVLVEPFKLLMYRIITSVSYHFIEFGNSVCKCVN